MLELWTEETYNNVKLAFKTTQVLFSDKSPFQTVDIVDTETYGRLLLLDGMVMTTERDEFVYHEMISHVALLSHPNPKRVLIIGGGDGGTLREVLKHTSVEEAVLCEIDGMVIDACKQFMPSIASDFDHPKATIIVGDGIDYMANQAKGFDVILVDSADPVGPGEGLFTKEFYQNTFNALNEDGIMVAQTGSPIMEAAHFTRIYKLYGEIFPIAMPYFGQIPTYPGGLWTWSFCSKRYPASLTPDAEKRAKAIEATCQYFNTGIYQGAFGLPNFVKKLVPQTATSAASVL